MKTEIYRPLIDAAAALVGLPEWNHLGEIFTPGEWLEGLILHESSGDPHAVHHDGAIDDADNTSYGLMQVEGITAKRLGLIDYSKLFLPITNIAFGLQVLTGNLAQSSNRIDTALARYNGGSFGNPGVDGRLRNQQYVDMVATESARVQMSRTFKT